MYRLSIILSQIRQYVKQIKSPILLAFSKAKMFGIYSLGSEVNGALHTLKSAATGFLSRSVGWGGGGGNRALKLYNVAYEAVVTTKFCIDVLRKKG